MADCGCGSGKTRLIYACSGQSDVGEVADKTARMLRDRGFGKMACLSGIGADISGFIESAKGSDENIVIDGCPVACAKKIVEQAGAKAKSYVLTEMGLEKGQTPVTETVVQLMSDKIAGNKAGNKQENNNSASGCSCCG